MRTLALLSFLLLLSASLFAQDHYRLYLDKYNGLITGAPSHNTALILRHRQYADMGGFTLTETPEGQPPKKTVTTKGDWTVLKGSATDDDATVVELDIKSGGNLYYLRLKNGDLQQLDSTLNAIKPVSGHMLHKEKYKP